MLGLALGGCEAPIEAYRSLSGLSRNDPDPATAAYTGNLAEAEAAPYPNLASVPPPPSRATTAAERQKLTQSLVADRVAAAQAGSAVPAAPQVAGAAKAEVPPVPGPGRAAAPGPMAMAPQSPRAAGAPPEPIPMDASMEVPQIRSLPEPDTVRPPPPPPRLATLPPPAAASQLPAAAIAGATPQAAPPPPEFVPVAPPPAPAFAAPEPRRPPAATTVAMLDTLDRSRIAQIAARYKESPTQPSRSVRVIAHAAAPAPGADPLAGYHAALDRAQEFAKALTEAGIPANRIHIEAAPAIGATAAARVEIQFLP